MVVEFNEMAKGNKQKKKLTCKGDQIRKKNNVGEEKESQ